MIFLNNFRSNHWVFWHHSASLSSV